MEKVKVKFKIINPDYIFFKKVEYLETINPRIELKDRNIFIVDENKNVMGVFPSDYSIIVVAYKPASQVSLLARFNNDSNTRYTTQTGSGSNDFSSVSFTQASFKIQNDVDDSTATGISVTDVFYYANTSIWKMAHTLFIGNHPAVPADVRGNRFFGIYNQTTAIDRIDLFPSSGNFTSGTAYLYGIK